MDLQSNEELLKEIKALKDENAKLVKDAKDATKKQVDDLRAALSNIAEKVEELEQRFVITAKERERVFRGETILVDVANGYVFADAHGNVKYRAEKEHDEKFEGDDQDKEFQKVNRGLPGNRQPVQPGFSH